MTDLLARSKGFQRIKIFITFFGATLVSVVYWSEQIEKLFEGKGISYLFAFSGLIRVDEILFIILIALICDNTYAVLRQACPFVWAMVMYGNHDKLSSSHARTLGIAILFVVLSMSGLTLYHLSYLAIGKYIFISNYDKRLLTQSVTDFQKGRLTAAKVRLEICVKALISPRCQLGLENIAQRIQMASLMRRLLDKVPRSNYAARFRLFSNIHYLINDKYAAEEISNALQQELRGLRVRYIDSLELIVAGRVAEAKKNLGIINTSFPGYGDAHIIMRELDAHARNPSAQTPYLLALTDLAPLPFAVQTIGATLAFAKPVLNSNEHEAMESRGFPESE